MLQLGDEATLYSLIFVGILLGTRSPVWTVIITASLYLFLAMFRFPQVPSSRTQKVLHPVKGTAGTGKVSVIAHRGGGHDAPENTIASILEVREWGGEGFGAIILHLPFFVMAVVARGTTATSLTSGIHAQFVSGQLTSTENMHFKATTLPAAPCITMLSASSQLASLV